GGGGASSSREVGSAESRVPLAGSRPSAFICPPWAAASYVTVASPVKLAAIGPREAVRSPVMRPLSTEATRAPGTQPAISAGSHTARHTASRRSEEHTSELQSLTNLVCR